MSITDDQSRRLTKIRDAFNRMNYTNLYFRYYPDDKIGGAGFLIPESDGWHKHTFIKQPGEFEQAMNGVLTQLETIAGIKSEYERNS